MLELNCGVMLSAQSNRRLHARKTRVEPIVLYGYGAVSSLCHGDDATQNVSRSCDVMKVQIKYKH